MENKHSKLIRKTAYGVNTILLLCHIGFAVWYWREDMRILFNYNLISLAVFLLGFILIRRDRIPLMTTLNYIEITTFMVLNTLMLGWNYGFEFYAVGLLVSAFLVQVQLSEDRTVHPTTIVYAVFIAIGFLAVRIWLYHHDPVYPPLPIADKMYLFNAALVFSMLISFTNAMLRTSSDIEKGLFHEARHDELTQLPNRREIHERLSAEKPGWIAILDLDHFKRINDRYGHAAGDETLRTAASILQAFAQEKGCSVGRYGGEEFLLYGKAAPDVPEMLEELRGRLCAARVRSGNREISITVTIGVCEEADTTHEMLHLADKRLYRGKWHGRNQVVSD